MCPPPPRRAKVAQTPGRARVKKEHQYFLDINNEQPPTIAPVAAGWETPYRHS